MLRSFTKKALVGAIGSLFLGVAAHATTVTYSELGSEFQPGSGNYSNGSGSATVINTGGLGTGAPVLTGAQTAVFTGLGLSTGFAAGETVFLAYNGSEYVEFTYTSQATPVTPNVYAMDIGEFGFATNVPVSQAEDFSGFQFVLDITQSSPPGGTGSTTGDVTGTLTLNANGNQQKPNLSINFSNPNIFISSSPAIEYSVDPNPVTIQSSGTTNPSYAFLDADITVAPLPESANMGLALLAGVACVGALRRRAKMA